MLLIQGPIDVLNPVAGVDCSQKVLHATAHCRQAVVGCRSHQCSCGEDQQAPESCLFKITDTNDTRQSIQVLVLLH